MDTVSKANPAMMPLAAVLFTPEDLPFFGRPIFWCE
jgi:hypothetical protein